MKALKVVGTIVKWYAIANTLFLAAIGFMDIILDEPEDWLSSGILFWNKVEQVKAKGKQEQIHVVKDNHKREILGFGRNFK